MSHDISSTGSNALQKSIGSRRFRRRVGLHGAEKCGTSLGAHGHRFGLHPAGPRKAAGEQGTPKTEKTCGKMMKNGSFKHVGLNF